MTESSILMLEIPELTERVVLERKQGLISPSVIDENEPEPHVTLLYGLEHQQPEMDMIDVFETYPKFSVMLGAIDIFEAHESNSGSDVVIVKIESPDLHVLHHTVREMYNVEQMYDEYRPHLTLAYVQPNSCDHLRGLRKFHGLTFVCDHIIFSNARREKRNIYLGLK